MVLKTQGTFLDVHETSRSATAAFACECVSSVSLFFLANSLQNGTILTYPNATQVSVVSKEQPKAYIFGPKFQEHTFCDICGVSLYLKQIPGAVDFDKYPEWEGKLPVNLRCFEGVEWEEVEVKRGDWRNQGIEYVVPA